MARGTPAPSPEAPLVTAAAAEEESTQALAILERLDSGAGVAATLRVRAAEMDSLLSRTPAVVEVEAVTALAEETAELAVAA